MKSRKRKSHKNRLAGFAGVVAAGAAAVARGDFIVQADPNAVYTAEEGAVVPAQGDVISSNPSAFAGIDIGSFIGADTFYNAGFTGQNTTSENVEAGEIWNQAESLTNVSGYTVGTGALGQFDRHATWVGMIIGGRQAGASPGVYQQGIAYGTNLTSGAVATSWSGTAYATSFSFSGASLFSVYQAAFGTADVINSSWNITDVTGTSETTVGIDGLARANPQTTFVTSAGNSGPSSDSLGGPGTGYNGITVGALQNVGNNGSGNGYNVAASFSSRGPQDYSDPVNGTVSGVRSPVDLVAPGDALTSAFYGGTTGGNSAALGGTATAGTALYNSGLSGTSFAAPIVAGCVSLLDSAAKNTAGLSTNINARDARVIKAVLMNSADKVGVYSAANTPWSNGQTTINGVITTTQSVDYTLGAGRVDMTAAYSQYLAGTTDVAGTGGGSIKPIGWDYGVVSGVGSHNDYTVNTQTGAGATFNVTLDWFADRTYINNTSASNDAFQNLDLQVWNSTFTTLIAQSDSIFNNVEELSFNVPLTQTFGIRVLDSSVVFGTAQAEAYGLAWDISGGTVPEPAAIIGLGASILMLNLRRRSPSKNVEEDVDLEIINVEPQPA